MTIPVGGLLDTEEKLKVGSEIEFRIISVKGDNLTRIYFHKLSWIKMQEECNEVFGFKVFNWT